MRFTRRPGVLPNTFKAPLRSALIGGAKYPDAYSKIVGTPICMGENDVHSNCVTVAAFNACAAANARRGIFTPFADHEPFDLFVQLGGMPADIGLDPAVLFNHWKENAVGGYLLENIEEIALNDIAGIEQTIIDNGFIYSTEALTQAQMTQTDWVPVQSPLAGDHATIQTWWEAGWLYDETWGEQVRVSPEFITAQGLNLWRLDLKPA